jgi:glutathione S-transferase
LDSHAIAYFEWGRSHFARTRHADAIYYAPHTISLATHIVLEEVGADYSTVRIDFSKTQQRSPEYLKVNPKGRMPALVTDRGILTETPAMLVYVAQSLPQSRSRARPTTRSSSPRSSRSTPGSARTCTSAHAHRKRGYRWVDADDAHSIAAMQRKVPQSVGESFAMIEREMLHGPWVMGERYTICDPYLFTLAQWLEADGVDPMAIPRVIDHRGRMAERATVRKAIAQQLA